MSNCSNIKQVGRGVILDGRWERNHGCKRKERKREFLRKLYEIRECENENDIICENQMK